LPIPISTFQIKDQRLPGADDAPQQATIPLSGLSLKRGLIPSGYTPLAPRGALPVVFLPLFLDAPVSF
jgi:hypothetical protein